MGCGNSKGNRVVESVSENTAMADSQPGTLSPIKAKPGVPTINLIPSATCVITREGAIEDSYQFLETLGRGAFAEVKKAIFKATKEARAVKIIHKIGLGNESIDKKHKLREMKVLRELDHPNVLRVHEIYEDKNRYYIVMEYCEGGDLFSKLLDVKRFTEVQVGKLLYQILSVVTYCHQRWVIHRDLKPENLLLERRGKEMTIKVADFGSSSFLDPKKKLSGVHGSAYYVAPEVLREAYNEKCDLWSCGIILYILLTGRPPYAGRTEKEILAAVSAGSLDISGLERVSSEARDLTHQLLNRDYRFRISAKDALNHPFVQNSKDAEGDSGTLLTSAFESLKDFHCSSKLKDAIHTFIATQIVTQADLKDLRESFQAIDRNGDGRISREELFEKYRSVMASTLADQEVTEIMNQVDTNHSGFIDYTEFLHASLNQAKHLREENLKIAFALFDKDSSGKISARELREMLSGSLISDDKVWKELVSEVDQNGDGEIDLREFEELLLKQV